MQTQLILRLVLVASVSASFALLLVVTSGRSNPSLSRLVTFVYCIARHVTKQE